MRSFGPKVASPFICHVGSSDRRAYAKRHGPEGIHPVIVEGSAPDCFPPALLEVNPEPLAADFAAGKDGFEDGALKLIAGVLGAPFGVLKDREAARARRRMRLMGAAAAMFAALTLVAGYSAYRAVEEAARAETELARAEAAIGVAVDGVESVVVELAQDTAAGRIHIDAAAELLTTTERVAARVVDIAPGDPSLKVSYGRLLAQLSETFVATGDSPRAEDAALHAIRLFNEAESENAELSGAIGDARIHSIMTLAATAMAMGDSALSSQRLDQAEAAAKALPAPTILAEITGRRALLARSEGDVERALELFSLELEQRSALHDVARPDTALPYGEAMIRRGDMAVKMGMPQTANASYILAHGILERAYEQSDRAPHFRESYAKVLSRLAAARRGAGELDRAQELIAQSVALNAELSADDPRNTKKAVTLMTALAELSDVNGALGRLSNSRAASTRAAEIAAELVALDPGNQDYQRALIEQKVVSASAETSLGQPRNALDQLNQARSRLTAMTEISPDVPQFRALLADIDMRRAEVIFTLGDAMGALDIYKQTVVVFEDMLAGEPQNIAYLAGHAEALRAAGHAMAFTGGMSEASVFYQHMGTALDTHGTYSVHNREHAILRARATRTLGIYWDWWKQRELALSYFELSQRILLKSYEDHGATAALDREFIKTSLHLSATKLAESGSTTEGRETASGYLAKGREALLSMLSRAPGDFELRFLNARYLVADAQLARSNSNMDEAWQSYRSAIAEFYRLEATNPEILGVPQWRGITNAYFALASADEDKRTHLERAEKALVPLERIGGLDPLGRQALSYVQSRLSTNE